MSVLVDRSSRIVIQGITGGTGRFFAERMRTSETPLVCGVVPGRGGQQVAGVPVYDTIAEAAALGVDCSLICVPAPHVLEAFTEAAASGLRLVWIYSENVPIHDTLLMLELARSSGTVLLGPNSAGVVTPTQANLSDLADENVPAGRVGVVSKSGTLTYEVLDLLREVGQGASTVVCLGGDPIVGLVHEDVLEMFARDTDTDAVVLVGEIGGEAEIRAAERWIELGAPKPLVAFIAGHSAPVGRRMGHAGAIVRHGFSDSAVDKSNALRDLGCSVVELMTDIPAAVQSALPGGNG